VFLVLSIDARASDSGQIEKAIRFCTAIEQKCNLVLCDGDLVAGAFLLDNLSKIEEQGEAIINEVFVHMKEVQNSLLAKSMKDTPDEIQKLIDIHTARIAELNTTLNEASKSVARNVDAALLGTEVSKVDEKMTEYSAEISKLHDDIDKLKANLIAVNKFLKDSPEVAKIEAQRVKVVESLTKLREIAAISQRIQRFI
jgi:cellobiose-specific phosphotransferase system component IIB